MKGWPPRFCAACGARVTSIANRGERRRCPKCAWTFYANPVPAAVGVVIRRGQLLMTRRANPPFAGTWDLPGGFIEADETPDVALARELREELGIGTSRARFIGFATDRYGSRGFPVLTMIYRVTVARGTLRPGDDVSEVRWFRLDRVPFRTIAFPSMRRVLRAYLRNPR